VPPQRHLASEKVAAATKKAEQSEATRRKLLDVARRLFARHGYTGTSIAGIVKQARVTRGALYHHFTGKEDVFRAVYEDLQAELAAQMVESAGKEPRPEKHLEVGCEVFLDACLDRTVQQIALLDAPSVLGWDVWHEIDEEHSLGLLTAALEVGMQEGYFDEQPTQPLAQLLLGALTEAGLAIARADDPAGARKTVGESVSRLIAGLRPAGARS
jgi:AcrR family transcriptional regulator